MFYLLAWQMQVSKSDSGDSPPEDDPDSVVVEYVDFVKVIEFGLIRLISLETSIPQVEFKKLYGLD